MSDLDEFEDRLRTHIGLGAGLDGKVVPGNDNLEQPDGVYASLLLITDADDGGYPVVEDHPTDADPNAVAVFSQQLATYSLQFYRAGAVAAARRFKRWATSPEGLQSEVDNRLRIMRPINIQRLDADVFSDWQERAVITMDVRYVDSDSARSLTVDSVEATVDVVADGTAHTLTITQESVDG